MTNELSLNNDDTSDEDDCVTNNNTFLDTQLGDVVKTSETKEDNNAKDIDPPEGNSNPPMENNNIPEGEHGPECNSAPGAAKNVINSILIDNNDL